MKKGKESFFQKRKVAASFGVAALLFGFYFLNAGFGLNLFTGRVTGNYVAEGTNIINATNLIGMVLIVCSAILIIYAIVKKE